MANLFETIPVPSANGSGAPVDLSAFGATKTFTVSSDNTRQPPTITLEFNNAASSSDGSWQAIKTFQGGGQLTVDLACKWVRATVTNYRGGASLATVGGTDSGTLFANLPTTAGNGAGTPVDVSTLGLFKTVQSSKPSRGSTQIEISNDSGASWSTLISFNGPTSSSAVFAADMMRVTRNGVPVNDPGQPEVNVAACVIGSGGGGGGDGVLLQNRGAAVAGGPFSTLNLRGPIGANSGGGVAAVTLAPFVVNVLDYGAVGDGTTDDTVAILAAFTDVTNPASRNYGLAVYFPMTTAGGQYLIVSTNQPGRVPAIQLSSAYSGLRLIGAGSSGIKFDSVCIDGVSGSPGIEVQSGFHDLDVENLWFYGAVDDRKDFNFFGAIKMANGATDVRITRCTFDHVTPVDAATALSGTDEPASARLTMTACHMKNCPNGVHPPSDTKIHHCYFICDTLSADRAQAIYKFGSFSNIEIIGCSFYRITKQAVQIRGVEAAWNQMTNFRIEGCSFTECDQYAIFCGSDSIPNVTQAAIVGNNFLNCNGPIQCQGIGSATIVGNVIHYNWEWPFGPVPFSVAIFASTGVGLPGHYNARSSVVIADNKLSHVHPYVGKVQFTSNPDDGDQILVGGIQYTFRNSPSAPFDIQRDPVLRNTVDYFVRALQGFGDEITVPNNALRSATDAFNNFYGTNPNLAVIVSFFTFDLSSADGFATITAPTDYRSSCLSPITAQYLTGGTISDNKFDDFVYGVVVQNCTNVDVSDNQNSNQTGQATAVLAQFNVFNRYKGNRCISPDPLNQGTPSFSTYQDGFPIIDDDQARLQEGCYGPLMGRAGSTPIGDGSAHCWLWYGSGIPGSDPADPSTNMFRWQDGDLVILNDGTDDFTFTYQFTTPGAGEFNSPDSLLALINATPGFTATYQPYINRRVTPDPKCMINIAYDPGSAGNDCQLYVYRPKYPGAPTSTAERTQQPLINGVILRNQAESEQFSPFGGGAATAVATFVFSPIANPDRGVDVWGADAAAVALNPVVYKDDIIPGVGFLIRHDVAVSGEEEFFYRVNS